MMKNMQWFVRETINRYVDATVHALDMTMGNGHDTLYLAKRAKKVSAFDVQSAALDATKVRLEPYHFTHVALYHASHEDFQAYIDEPYGFVMFNCGYLPGSDKTLTTQAHVTANTLQKAYAGLSVPGAIVLTLYKQHSGAKEELQMVHDRALTLPHARLSSYRFLQQQDAPEVLLIEKLSE